MRRIVADVRPSYVFAENVQRDPIARAATELYALGYTCAYTCTLATDVGCVHGRRRWWLVAHAHSQGKSRFPLDVQVARVQDLPCVAAWHEDLSGALGVVDGMAHRMDRLAALGDGQVPTMAAMAWRLLFDHVQPES